MIEDSVFTPLHAGDAVGSDDGEPVVAFAVGVAVWVAVGRPVGNAVGARVGLIVVLVVER